MDLQVEHCIDRETFEQMIENIGDRALATKQRQQETSRRALEAVLPAEVLPAYRTHSDAVSEAFTIREFAAARVSLTLGVGIGAALAAYPDETPETLVAVASGAVRAVLAVPVEPGAAQDMVEFVLKTLRRVTVSTL